MKTFGLLALIVFLGALCAAAPADGLEAVKRGNFPGLDGVQTANARAIIAENARQQFGWHGCVVAITAALTESSLRILANHAVPASLAHRHDGLGADYDSVGLFQQRATWYTDIACGMRAACSTDLFFRGMTAVGGWQAMDAAALCQAVQRSERPEAYRRYVEMATGVCRAAGL